MGHARKIKMMASMLTPETKEKLKHFQNNPTTGTPHNAQMVFSQVESVFAMDSLQVEISGLRQELRESNLQSSQLEASNYKLQWAVFVLTSIAVFISVVEFFDRYLTSILQNIPHITSSLADVISVLAALLAGVLSFAAQKRLVNHALEERIRVSDHLNITARDSRGNIKDRR